MQYTRTQVIEKVDQFGETYTSVRYYNKDVVVSEYNRDNDPEYIATHAFKYGFALKPESQRGVGDGVWMKQYKENFTKFLVWYLTKATGISRRKAAQIASKHAETFSLKSS